MIADVELTVAVNGASETRHVPPRLTLADYLRDWRGLTGTHLGCEQGVCGACTVLVDGQSVRSCLTLAVQVQGARVTTVEGLADVDEPLSGLQRAFTDNSALQCGFCTPGLLMACSELLDRDALDEPTVRSALSGNLCRCTGYSGIVAAVLQAHAERQDGTDSTPVASCVATDKLPEWVGWTPARRPRRRATILLAAGVAIGLAGALAWAHRRGSAS